MVKLIACILLFSGSTALGFGKAASYQERRRELEDTLELIRLLHLEIAYRKDGLAKVFQRTGQKKPCWFADVLRECAAGLETQEPLERAWQDALQKGIRGCPLYREDTVILTDLFLGLGRSDTRGQEQILKPATERLQQQIRKARDQEEKMGRLYRSLGMAAGVIAAILVV